jgi:Domain of unknown function (DUF222)
MPDAFGEFTGRELGAALGISLRDAAEMLDLARHLEVNLPATNAAFRAGILNHDKAVLIAAATAVLDPAEARAAEAMVLGRAGSLTPAALRAAIQRAVMEVNPGKARKRREHAAKRTRVERWFEDSGNAGLAGRELPPAEVLAADQRVTAWAKELRKAGLAGRPGEMAGIGPIDPNPGSNTSDCYRSQERADPARAAHPPRPDLPDPPTPGPRCQARSKPAGAGDEGPGVRPLSTRLFPMARHSAQLAVRDRRDRGTVARQPGNDGHL